MTSTHIPLPSDDNEFRELARTWLHDNVIGDFAALRGRGGPGDEDIGFDICISLCGKEIDFLSGLRVKCKKIAEIHFSMSIRKDFIIACHKGVLWRLLGEIRTLQLKNATKRLDKLVVLTKSDEMNWNKTHNNIKQIYNFIGPTCNETSNLKNKRAITVGRLDAQKGYDMHMRMPTE
jgi:hypothetical protein